MSEISKAYEPQSVEDKWYQFWLDQKCFVADPARVSAKRPAYSIVIPPPNVTGVLTMGHVLNNTIQDILARKARMDGKEVLWLPGTDHAGIATEGMVTKQLRKEEKKSKQEIGREEFIKRVWQWKEKHGGIIISQLKKLGCSCDWSRERFTMDADYVRNVQRVFVHLYKNDLIYRGKRMVNWCPATQTALSDEEVVMKEQKGLLYYFKVEVAETPGTFLTIATTRPETIPGDTAVAVNPKDSRYAHLIGKHVIRPLPSELPREQKLIPIISDEHVDFEFGTGVLKVTPAHDKADYEIFCRLSSRRMKDPTLPEPLDPIEVIGPNGVMTERAGERLKRLDRFKARKTAVEVLMELALLEKEEPYTNNVGFSERADVPIEPRLSWQWFLEYPSALKSRSVVSSGEMKFHPERWARVYDHWMNGLQDWCISRQLWWGHRIPVWSRSFENEVLLKAGMESLKRELGDSLLSKGKLNWGGNKIYLATEDPELEKRIGETKGFSQEPDVLDTWFSSWLWPFATMGWTGDKSQDSNNPALQAFYPTTDLVTGPDIIFFWVARMIMAGYEFMGEMPFKNVYFTGIIRDKQGRKMSKSLGNSPDPLDLINKYSADALRFGTMRSAPLGQDILFDEQNVELGRNFCNKLWNACRFRQMQGGEVQGEIDPRLLTSDDKWILLRLDQAIREIDAAFAEYKFSDATATLYRFFWSEYCDWYVEATKVVLGSARVPHADSDVSSESSNDNTSGATPDTVTGTVALPENFAARKANTLAVIDFVLSHALRLFHPFLPFITEELWHGVGYADDMPQSQGGQTIMFAPWPKPLDDDFKSHYGLSESEDKFVSTRNELVSQGRNLRRIANIAANKKVKYVLKPPKELPAHDIEVLAMLLNAESLELNSAYKPPKGTPSALGEPGEIYLPLAGQVDFAAERARLMKELEKVRAEIAKVQAKLSNPNFVQKVPPKVLQDHQQRLADWQTKEKQILDSLDNLPK